ncbi:hypothetical protein SYNPS1DRAFT_31305, partial [Syncephalis pseudoplumigaleata]
MHHQDLCELAPTDKLLNEEANAIGIWWLTSKPPAKRQLVPQTKGESHPRVDDRPHRSLQRHRKRSLPNLTARSPSPLPTFVVHAADAAIAATTPATSPVPPAASAAAHTVRPVDSPYLVPKVESFASINSSTEILACSQPTGQSPPTKPHARHSKEIRANPFSSSHFLLRTSLKLYSPTEPRKDKSDTGKHAHKGHDRLELPASHVDIEAAGTPRQSVVVPACIDGSSMAGTDGLRDLQLDQLLTPAAVAPLSQMHRRDIPMTLPEFSPLTPFIDERRFSEGDSQSLIDIVHLLTKESTGDDGHKKEKAATRPNATSSSNSNTGKSKNARNKHAAAAAAASHRTLSRSAPDQMTGIHDAHAAVVADVCDEYADEQSNIWPDAPNSTFIWDSSSYGEKLIEEQSLDVQDDYYDAISYRPIASTQPSQVSSPTCPFAPGEHDSDPRQVL